jgi:hypothetical protein
MYVGLSSLASLARLWAALGCCVTLSGLACDERTLLLLGLHLASRTDVVLVMQEGEVLGAGAVFSYARSSDCLRSFVCLLIVVLPPLQF